jgi:hypothetical protein
MKPNKKILDLIESGFSFKTLNKLSEKQLTQLHSRIIKEYVDKTDTRRDYTKIEVDKGVLQLPTGAKTLTKNPDGTATATESKDIDMVETKKRKSKNPWAICTSSLADEFGTSERSEWTKSQMKKYERCVMGVKEKMNEGKNPFEFILENKITQLIEKHVHPKMTKKDFLEVLTKKMIQESKPKEKEKEKEKTKPGTKPNEPYKPKPGPNPRPKAKELDIDTKPYKLMPDFNKDEILKQIKELQKKEEEKRKNIERQRKKEEEEKKRSNDKEEEEKSTVKPNSRHKSKKTEVDEAGTKTKPTTKPGTKPTTKPGTPFSPKPGPNPAPKAKKGNIPDWFTFDKLGLKIR